ncbi:MAG: hypothetical protein ACXWRE_09275 [Pseudobdellovibrionaceae bacterium]
MILSLHRSHRMAVNILKPGVPQDARAFVFDVALGLKRQDVDSLSGMVLNLVQVDSLLHELEQRWKAEVWHSFPQLLRDSLAFVEERLAQEAGGSGVEVIELYLREIRGFWLKSQAGRTEKLFSGLEEIHEWDGELFRIRYQYLLDELRWEQQHLKLNCVKDLFSEKVFADNPGLESVEIENLASAEKWNYSSEPN